MGCWVCDSVPVLEGGEVDNRTDHACGCWCTCTQYSACFNRRGEKLTRRVQTTAGKADRPALSADTLAFQNEATQKSKL